MPAPERVVKVRINASGRRLIGYVTLPPDEGTRFSDLLNGPEAYMLVRTEPPEESTGEEDSVAVRKDSISYIEALDEPATQMRPLQGSFRRVTVELDEPAVAIEGELFVGADRELVGVFNDARRFISLRDVRVVDSIEAYHYLALGKHRTKCVRF
jgi:hypothetical protein